MHVGSQNFSRGASQNKFTRLMQASLSRVARDHAFLPVDMNSDVLPAGVAQLVEHVLGKDGVTGSIPVSSFVPSYRVGPRSSLGYISTSPSATVERYFRPSQEEVN